MARTKRSRRTYGSGEWPEPGEDLPGTFAEIR